MEPRLEVADDALALHLVDVLRPPVDQALGLVDHGRQQEVSDESDQHDERAHHHEDRPPSPQAAADQPGNQGLQAEGQEDRDDDEGEELGQLQQHVHQTVGEQQPQARQEAGAEGGLTQR